MFLRLRNVRRLSPVFYNLTLSRSGPPTLNKSLIFPVTQLLFPRFLNQLIFLQLIFKNSVCAKQTGKQMMVMVGILILPTFVSSCYCNLQHKNTVGAKTTMSKISCYYRSVSNFSRLYYRGHFVTSLIQYHLSKLDCRRF